MEEIKFKFIKNYDELIKHSSPENRETRTKALTLIEEGLMAANPKRAVKKHLRIVNEKLIINKHEFEINKFKGTTLLVQGKHLEKWRRQWRKY